MSSHAKKPRVDLPRSYQKSKSQPKPEKSILDIMKDGREFESAVSHKYEMELVPEMRRSLSEIEKATGRYPIAMMANIVNLGIKRPISINLDDDLPFSEMINSVPDDVKDIDIILVTPGGNAQQVAKFVDKLRPRFDSVNFIIPNMAMSAGTIFSMCGDKIYMGPNSYIGPIDPQVPNKNGQFRPAQAILTAIQDIQSRGEELIKKGQNPKWTDLQILRQIDAKEIGNALAASDYSIDLVKNYLKQYKLQKWKKHNSSGDPVTEEERETRAKEIAAKFCDHGLWKSHSRGIPRDVAWQDCKLKIDHFESVDGLERAVRRNWALMNWAFENSPMAKVFLSQNYCLFRNDMALLNNKAR